MWHAIIVPQSASLITSTIQWPGTRWAAIWWSTSSPQGSLSFLILGYPNLEKTPSLSRFYKKKEKTGLLDKKKTNDMIGNWSISTRDLLPSKIMNFKKIHTFSLFIKKLPLLLNLTQFYIPGNNPNLKMNLYGKLHFLKNKDPGPHHRAQGTTRTKKNNKWETRTTDMFYLGH